MTGFASIAVDIDAKAVAHPALAHAASLARAAGARLTILDVLNIPPYAHRQLSHALEQTLITDRRERLAAYAGSVRGVATSYSLLTGRPAIALTQEVLRSGHDLLVRAHARDLAAPRPPTFGAVDMQLIRQCPCPVWLVGPASVRERPPIVAAVNTTDDDTERRLNRKLMDIALAFTQLRGGTLTALQAWAAFGEEVLQSHCSPAELSAYVEHAGTTARTGLDDLVRACDVPEGSVRKELRKGPPEDVIPQFTVAQGVDTIVMGTVARTGIAGLVIGNTAERLLQRLSCSVLAVKPDGFVSPVEPPAT